jgi:hypothetical protein
MSNSSVGLPTESRTIRFVPAHLSASASWTGFSREKSACQCSHSIGRRMNTFFRQNWRSAKFLTERSDHEAALLAGWQGDDVEIVVATVTASRNLSHWGQHPLRAGDLPRVALIEQARGGLVQACLPVVPRYRHAPLSLQQPLRLGIWSRTKSRSRVRRQSGWRSVYMT